MRGSIGSGNGGGRRTRATRGAVLLLVPGFLFAAAPGTQPAPEVVELRAADFEAQAETSMRDPHAGDEAVRLVIGAASRLWVEGGSTVRAYSCEAERLDGAVDLDDRASGTRVADLAGRVRRMEVTVPVSALECGNDTMNRHMLDALKAGEHATIRFRMSRAEVVATDGAGTAMLEGTLGIAGQEQPALLVGQLAEGEGGRLTVTGQYALDMTTFGVRPPRLMLGTLRVHDDVVVHYELVLEP